MPSASSWRIALVLDVGMAGAGGGLRFDDDVRQPEVVVVDVDRGADPVALLETREGLGVGDGELHRHSLHPADDLLVLDDGDAVLRPQAKNLAVNLVTVLGLAEVEGILARARGADQQHASEPSAARRRMIA